jgi:hypothetical protein
VKKTVEGHVRGGGNSWRVEGPTDFAAPGERAGSRSVDADAGESDPDGEGECEYQQKQDHLPSNDFTSHRTEMFILFTINTLGNFPPISRNQMLQIPKAIDVPPLAQCDSKSLNHNINNHATLTYARGRVLAHPMRNVDPFAKISTKKHSEVMNAGHGSRRRPFKIHQENNSSSQTQEIQNQHQ